MSKAMTPLRPSKTSRGLLPAYDDNRPFHFVPQPWAGLALRADPQAARRRCPDPTVWGLRRRSPPGNSRSRKRADCEDPFPLKPGSGLRMDFSEGWFKTRNGLSDQDSPTSTISSPDRIFFGSFKPEKTGQRDRNGTERVCHNCWRIQIFFFLSVGPT